MKSSELLEPKKIDLEVPETLDIWSELSPKTKRDLVAVARLSRKPLMNVIVEAIIYAGVLGELEGPTRNDYQEEIEELSKVRA